MDKPYNCNDHIACRRCTNFLETQDELSMKLCEECAIDEYQEHMRQREQAYLEDDSNW